ncbi:MAG: sigma-54-dependent Fis family transcriptional regulator [Deltaproteobacteria bacterium]|nr:sigma-54-dependent Fis family transcriptional regulator [Deltaproteobacteria bacterium]
MPTILIIDDDESMCHVLTRTVKRMGCEAVAVGTLAAGRSQARARSFDVVFLDVRLPDGNGLTMLRELLVQPSRPEIIIITGQGDPAGAELAISNGAWDYIEKTYSIQRISLTLKRALEYREARVEVRRVRGDQLSRERIIGASPSLLRALDQAALAAQGEAGVLLTGETGTGKELFARAIHQNSPRASGPFVVVDCAALPESIAQSILFGHKKGAFTGAEKDQSGLIPQADKGTLFLDEVGELPLAVQKNFLRAIQERTVRSLGDRDEKKSDFRLVAATNRDLEGMVEAGTFRDDLLYRLRGIHIHLPPLRERAGDIRLLAAHFLESRADGLPKTPSPDFLETLDAYDWPGNVRELIHALDHVRAVACLDPSFYPQHLPAPLRAKVARRRMAASQAVDRLPEPVSATGDIPRLQSYREEIWARAESEYLRGLLDSTGGNVKAAIHLSGLSQSRLYALLKKHGLIPRPNEK